MPGSPLQTAYLSWWYPTSITGRQRYQISLNPFISHNPDVELYRSCRRKFFFLFQAGGAIVRKRMCQRSKVRILGWYLISGNDKHEWCSLRKIHLQTPVGFKSELLKEDLRSPSFWRLRLLQHQRRDAGGAAGGGHGCSGAGDSAALSASASSDSDGATAREALAAFLSLCSLSPGSLPACLQASNAPARAGKGILHSSSRVSRRPCQHLQTLEEIDRGGGRNSGNRLWERSLFHSRMGGTKIPAYRTIRRIWAVWGGWIEPFKWVC